MQASAAPSEVIDRLLAAIAERDPDDSLSCFDLDRGVLIGSERGETADGPDGLRRFFELAFAMAGAYRFSFPERRWQIREEVAWLVADGTVIDPGAARPKAYRLVATLTRSLLGWRVALWAGSEPAVEDDGA